jgi:hypothetical protein
VRIEFVNAGGTLIETSTPLTITQCFAEVRSLP